MLTANTCLQVGKESGFMEMWLIHNRIWPSDVTYFIQYLFCLFLIKRFFWICYPEASRQWGSHLWTVQPFSSPWLGISKTTWKDCGFDMHPPSEMASRWPKAFNCLFDVVKIKFLSKNAEYFIGLDIILQCNGGKERTFNFPLVTVIMETFLMCIWEGETNFSAHWISLGLTCE